MKNVKIYFSIKQGILLMFIISLSVTIFCCGFLIFMNWTASANKTTARIASKINENIYDQVNSFIHEPYHINEINQKIIANNMLDLSNEKQRERYFSGVLSTYNEEIYSFTYGTKTGEYYGARRNEKGVIQILKNNAITGGESWYYSLNKDGTAGDIILRAGLFDPRTREWYKVATEYGVPFFSPIYKHFVMDDLTVSAAWPIYNEKGSVEGVLGTHMLLSNIGTYLKDAVKEDNGIAIIVEKRSDYLIANSLGQDNYSVLKDGMLERLKVENIKNIDIQKAYEEYKKNRIQNKIYKGELDSFFVNIRELSIDGIDWVIITAVPESSFMVDITKSMYWSIFLATIFLGLSILVYALFMGKYLKPMRNLLKVSGQLSAGDLSKRVPIVRDDEIGLISKSFNKVADKMQALIDNLENTVKVRTEELKETNLALEGSKDELRLILDSAAEAIYGLDLHGNCTFCNTSCIKMLGYNSQEELLGKNMHSLIHHKRRDLTEFPNTECSIFKAFAKGEGSHVDDEIFWRSDGTFFEVEYHSYPQIQNGKIFGVVVTFMDISERKQKEAKIHYMSCYDALTGLHNRRCFDENSAKIDKPDNLPLSIIFADINGLKMTNDIFGHAAGDELIKKSSEILARICRQNDVAARIGGDEFLIILPQTTWENAEGIIARIKAEFADASVKAIKCSISLGLDTKRSPDQAIEDIMANAENAMYKDKAENRKVINKDILNTLIKTLHAKSEDEKQHSSIVAKLCGEIGRAFNLSKAEISKAVRAGYLHDIGKIKLDKDLLHKDVLTAVELEKMQEHSSVGYRILNLFDDTLDLAEYVYAHHERWDGTGYPRGLMGEEIPVISRIIAVTETYARVLNKGKLSFRERKMTALEVIKKGAGTQFDPKIAGVFVQVINAKNKSSY